MIAGLGFRHAATLTALHEALRLAGGSHAVAALAVAAEKAAAPVLQALAADLGLPVLAIDAPMLRAMPTATWSIRIAARFGTGSVAEAAALAGAGPGARLLAARVVSQDRMATAAVAMRMDR